jgi:uncharacterized OsmC-like protein
MARGNPVDEGEVVVTGSARGFAQTIQAGKHTLAADEPEASGGTNTGPNPYGLLLAALGSCSSMTVALYARRKNWPLDEVTVRLRHSRVHAVDCAQCDTKEGRLDRIDWTIYFSGDLTAEQRSRLLEIAQMCPVHRTLTSKIDIRPPSPEGSS